ncbi:hypothetical protein P167DRAFT_545552 [Morchella conica CCBAS932]|uniref:Uncharacterized protein n=1 Tax=Morchella conica CCBAS932 TaxID=1392247 RepID=A0A3N4L2V9_9PEZI|nr:hypothetical protein P167DRAFT_545552 [Morchella conica CCBAS932]
MTASSQINAQPNPPPDTRKVEKWSEMVEQVQRTFDSMLEWDLEEYWIVHMLRGLQMYRNQYQTCIERFSEEGGLNEAGRLEAVAIRNNPMETPARRRVAIRSLDRSKFLVKHCIEAEARMRKQVLLMIYAERKLEMRKSLENY